MASQNLMPRLQFFRKSNQATDLRLVIWEFKSWIHDREEYQPCPSRRKHFPAEPRDGLVALLATDTINSSSLYAVPLGITSNSISGL
jgi:hypothetical protein